MYQYVDTQNAVDLMDVILMNPCQLVEPQQLVKHMLLN